MSEDRPAWWLCTRSSDPLFTAGAAYEVFRYDDDGRAIVATNRKRESAKLPFKRTKFVPYDPWGASRLPPATSPDGTNAPAYGGEVGAERRDDA